LVIVFLGFEQNDRAIGGISHFTLLKVNMDRRLDVPDNAKDPPRPGKDDSGDDLGVISVSWFGLALGPALWSRVVTSSWGYIL
jgi:hypothetical protein